LPARSWLAVLSLLALSLTTLPAATDLQGTVPLPQARRDLLATAKEVVQLDPEFNGSGLQVLSAGPYLAYVSRLAARLRDPVSFDRLLQDEDLTLNYLHHPHTGDLGMAESSVDSPGLLPIGLYWAADGLVAYRLQDSPASVRTGDRVLAIGGVPAARLIPRLRRYESGNGPWLRTLAGMLLPLGRTLAWLGLVHGGRVGVVLEHASGRRYDVSLALVPEDVLGLQDYMRSATAFEKDFLAPGPTVHGGPFYSWSLTPDYGIFWLRQCVDTLGYEKAVQAFFRAVLASGVGNVVIDLQQDSGGNSAVGLAFLRHLPLRPGFAAQYGVVQAPTQVFHGKLYVLVDGKTMSAAVMVAEQLSEAGYGALAGSPTGMASIAPGDVDVLTTPDGLITYGVSTEYTDSVNGAMTPALTPQAAVPVTVRDIQRGIDPVARWLSRLATPRYPT
jgi:hypothetical protein